MRLLVKQATSSGWIEMCVPGVCDLSYPNSKLRRGRVQGGVKSHLQSQQQWEFARLSNGKRRNNF